MSDKTSAPLHQLPCGTWVDLDLVTEVAVEKPWPHNGDLPCLAVWSGKERTGYFEIGTSRRCYRHNYETMEEANRARDALAEIINRQRSTLRLQS